jgi:hypothetical protein
MNKQVTVEELGHTAPGRYKYGELALQVGGASNLRQVKYVWSWVPRDSAPRRTALARTISNWKRQTRPLVREGVPHQQTRSCPWGLTPRQAGRLTVCCNVTLTLTNISELVASQLPSNEHMSMEAEEYPMSRAVTRQRLVKTENFVYAAVHWSVVCLDPWSGYICM